MIRTLVIQAVINARAARTYLEIGVDRGVNFFPIRAERKIAVDPSFKIDLAERDRWEALNPANRPALFYPMPSDDFFRSPRAPLHIDVAFIDGLHTCAQVLRDVDHCLARMDKRGVILLHDCNPPHEAAAFPADSLEDAAEASPPGWTGEWCGDVWKAVVHLRTRPDLNVFVVADDYGIAVVTRAEPEAKLGVPAPSRSNFAVRSRPGAARSRDDFTAEPPPNFPPEPPHNFISQPPHNLTSESPLDLTPGEIDALTWTDFDRDRERLLGLTSLADFFAFLGSPAWPPPATSAPQSYADR